jgi:hypothetical protein
MIHNIYHTKYISTHVTVYYTEYITYQIYTNIPPTLTAGPPQTPPYPSSVVQLQCRDDANVVFEAKTGKYHMQMIAL